MRLDLIIAGGKIVTPEGIARADLGVRGETIEAIGRDLRALAPRASVVDARGHYVLPGALDVHTHFNLTVGRGVTTADDFTSGTRAALRGGVTTIVDFATPEPGREKGAAHQPLGEAVEARMREAAGRCFTDFAFHVGVTRWEQHREEIPGLIRRGFPTFKEFMIYESRGLRSNDGAIFATLEAMRDSGGLLLLHAESPEVLDLLTAREHTPEKMRALGARLHAATRPGFVESEAVSRALTWCEATRGPLYFVHLSTAESVSHLRRARERGAPAWGETCPQYLTLDDSVFARPDGHRFVCAPRIQSRADQRALWEGLRRGDLDTVATDHCSFTRAQKDAWGGDWTRLPFGLPGAETMIPLLYTFGVLKKRLSLEALVEKTARNPARLMGLYPRKGALLPGSDADLVILHPTRRRPYAPGDRETRADWTPYDGWPLAGFARTALLRGRVVVDGYRIVAPAPSGQWLARRR